MQPDDAGRDDRLTHRCEAEPPSSPGTLPGGSGTIPPPPDPAAFQVPGYEILGELGRGGMGVVFKARQVGLKRVVALKMVIVDGLTDHERLTRFRAEAEAVAGLQHPNIVQVYEIGEHAGRPYFSMEYVEGVSLEQHLLGALLGPAQAAALVAQLADAMQYAHEHGIVHRDLKPANVLLQNGTTKHTKHTKEDTAEGKDDASSASSFREFRVFRGSGHLPKIADFGLAKHLQTDSGLTRSGAVLGTPSYMPPEQAEGSRAAVGVPADVYALGGILYAALTGRPPFRGATYFDTIYQVKHYEPVPPSRLQAKVPRDLEVICLKCLRKEPGRRYATAGDLADDLRRFLAGEPIRARPVGPAERAWRWCRRSPVVATLLGLVAWSVIAGVAGVFHYAVRAEEQARLADDARGAAEAARERAEKSEETLRRGLIRQHVDAGARYLDGRERGRALWAFLKALELEDAKPEAEESHRVRLGFTLQGGPQLVGACFHGRPVLDARFDPAGTTVLTRTDEPLAYLWDPFAGRLRTPPLAHDGDVRAALFSPDGRRVATASGDGRVRLWDAASGTLVHAVPLGSPVLSLAFAPDGGKVAGATQAGVVHFVDPQTGKLSEATLKADAAVYHVGFSPDGTRVVTADAGHQARVWDAATGTPVGKPYPHADHRGEDEYAITYRCWPAFSPDGRALATVHPNRKREAQPRVWDVATGQPLATPPKQNYFVRECHFAADGEGLLILCGNRVDLENRATGKREYRLMHPREAPHACYRPDGKALATCSTGGLVHVWDPAAKRQLTEPLRCGDGVHSLAYSADGRHLLVASHDGTARVWRMPGDEVARPYKLDCGNADRVFYLRGADKVRYSPDGRREVVYGDAPGARLGDARGKDAVALACQRVVTGAYFDADGRRLFTVDDQGALQWWDTATGRPAAPAVALGTAILAYDVSADGTRLMTLEKAPDGGEAGRAVSVWDVGSGRRLFGPLREWDSGPQQYGDRAILGRVTKAALSPDGKRLATSSDATGMLGVWDVDTGKELARGRCYHGEVYNLQFSGDGERFLTNGSDTIARLWSAATVKPAGPALPHPSYCRKADLNPDGWRVATVDGGNVIRVWDGRAGELLGRVDVPLRSNVVWFSRDGRRLVIDGGRRVLDVPRHDGARKDLPELLKLLTGLQREADDAIGPVEATTFLTGAARYRRAWLTWRGLADDPGAQPAAAR